MKIVKLKRTNVTLVTVPNKQNFVYPHTQKTYHRGKTHVFLGNFIFTFNVFIYNIFAID